MQSFYIAISSVSCREFACLMDRIHRKLLFHLGWWYLPCIRTIFDLYLGFFSSPRRHNSHIHVHEIQMHSESSKKILWHKVCGELTGELFTILFQIMHLIQYSWFLNDASSKTYLKNNILGRVLAKEQINSALPEMVKLLMQLGFPLFPLAF